MFRVTDNTLYRNAIRDLQSTAEAFSRAQQRVATGQRFQQASEDPSAAAAGMRERAEMQAIDRYIDANDSVDSRLRVVDTVLSDVVSSITAAKTRAASGRSTVLTAAQREAIALDIEGVREAIFTAINTSYRGIYLFSGAASTTAPYARSGSAISAYQGDTTVVQLDTSRTSSAEVTIDGGGMMQGGASSDLFATLDALSAAVRAGDMGAIDSGLTDLDAAFDRVTSAQSRVGATLNALPAERLRLDELRRASDTRRAQAEEVNLAEAIAEMTRAQQAQEAAIAATGTTRQLTLMDYLR